MKSIRHISPDKQQDRAIIKAEADFIALCHKEGLPFKTEKPNCDLLWLFPAAAFMGTCGVAIYAGINIAAMAAPIVQSKLCEVLTVPRPIICPRHDQLNC